MPSDNAKPDLPSRAPAKLRCHVELPSRGAKLEVPSWICQVEMPSRGAKLGLPSEASKLNLPSRDANLICQVKVPS